MLSETKQGVSLVWNPQLVAVWNQPKELDGITATPCMASSCRNFILYALRAMPCATSSGFHTEPAAWITKKELLVDKSSFFVGAGGGGRTRTVSLPTDFESASSANSNTPAKCIAKYFCYYITAKVSCQEFYPTFL